MQALFLDGFFSLIACCSCLAALTISKLSSKKTKHYPDGIYFLEPMYAIFKSILTLFLLATSVISTATVAFKYFKTGTGDVLVIGPVIPYAFLMVFMCFGLGFYNKRQNSRINNTSTILSAETKGNFVDGILSFGVGFAVILLKLIDINGALGFLHYTGDFFITTILVILSVKEPVKVLLNAFHELTGGTTTDKTIEQKVGMAIRTRCADTLKVQYHKIVKTGMHISVFIYLEENESGENISNVRKNILKDLLGTYENLELIFCK